MRATARSGVAKRLPRRVAAAIAVRSPPRRTGLCRIDIKDSKVTEEEIPASGEPEELAELLRYQPRLVVQLQEGCRPARVSQCLHRVGQVADRRRPGQALVKVYVTITDESLTQSLNQIVGEVQQL